MGLQFNIMENLHAPTVPSGPTTAPTSDNQLRTNGLTLAELQSKKDNLEAEIRALGSVLESVCFCRFPGNQPADWSSMESI